MSTQERLHTFPDGHSHPTSECWDRECKWTVDLLREPTLAVFAPGRILARIMLGITAALIPISILTGINLFMAWLNGITGAAVVITLIWLGFIREDNDE